LGKVVLEIGSDANLDMARHIAVFGPRLVIASNIEKGWPNRTPSASLLVTHADARDLAVAIGPETIDIVVGVAILERVSDVSGILGQVRRVLRPSGVAFLHGNPLWSSKKGHHLWVDAPGGSYRFDEETKNPIPDWGHLLYDRDELGDVLRARTVPEGDIPAIQRCVYDSPAINRVPLSKILAAIADAGMEQDVVKESFWSDPPNNATVQRLQERHGSERFEISDLRVILRKL
jgi:hypothetical protein